MKYFSLFAGIGGFELGIQQAYKKIGQKTKESIECVGCSEIDKYAIRIYEKHFNHKNYDNIKTINPKTLPNFDLLVGGFPCQPFSIAGKRKGFNDTRGTLFFDIARILKNKKPRLVLLENVKGLLSHDNGNTFKAIIATLAKLGYDVQWQVLNSQNFGVPQNRERVFIVGHLRGTVRPKVFPISENKSQTMVVPTITTRITSYGSGMYIRHRPQEKTITSRIKVYTRGGLQAHQKSRKDGIVPTLTQAAGMGGGQTPLVWSKKTNVRRLTPLECERLQGFPDGWTEGISDTQRYKCLGNAVTVNAVRKVAKKLLLSIGYQHE